MYLDEVPAYDDTSIEGIRVMMTYGESITIGDILYIKPADGKVYKASATAISTCPAIGLALETASSGSHSVLLYGIFRHDAWTLTVNGQVYLATSAGGITQSQPAATDNVIQVLGYATHSDRILFKPSADYVTHV